MSVLDDLRLVREMRKMTQRGLAQEAKTSQSAIARIEAKSVDPRLSTLTRIANILGARLILVIKE